MTREADETWEVFDDDLPLLGGIYSRARVRMTVVGLGGGDLLIVSPGKVRDEASFEALERRGRPRWLLAPNHFHNGGLATWKKRYPDIRVAAHPRAHKRLSKQVPDLGAIDDLDALGAALPEGVRVFGPPMARQGETWIAAKTSAGTAWLVCDAIVNDRKLPWFLWVLGFRPRLMTNPFFKRLFVESKADYKRWFLSELDNDPPAVLIPSHGGVERGADLVERLRRITEEA